jgi:hypothetical protein
MLANPTGICVANSETGQVIDGSDSPEPAVSQRHDGGGACIVGVGLVGAGRVEQPHPSRQGRRHIEHDLPGSDELLG